MELKHVVLVTDGLFPCQIGGIQKYSTELCKQLLQQDLKLTIICQQVCENLEPELKNVVKALNYKKYSGFPGAYIATLLSFSTAAKEYILQNVPNASIVYCQGLTGLNMHGITMKMPVVHNLHGLEMFQPVRGLKSQVIAFLFRIVASKLLRNAKHIVSLGAKLSEIIQSKSKTNIYSIPNAVSSEWINEFGITKDFSVEGERRFLFVGRYEWRKGIATLNEALKILDEQEFRGKITFIGDIPAHAMVNSNKVNYLGQVSNEATIKKVYAESDILICPSYSEGMPTVILEAMAAGMPVIATNVGASAELVSSENGKLIEPFEALELKDAMLYLNTVSKDDLRRKGEVGQNRAKVLYNWQHVGNEHVKIFKQICQES